MIYLWAFNPFLDKSNIYGQKVEKPMDFELVFNWSDEYNPGSTTFITALIVYHWLLYFGLFVCPSVPRTVVGPSSTVGWDNFGQCQLFVGNILFTWKLSHNSVRSLLNPFKGQISMLWRHWVNTTVTEGGRERKEPYTARYSIHQPYTIRYSRYSLINWIQPD